MEIKIVENEKEIKECFFVMNQLVTLVDENTFLKQVKRKEKLGYKLLTLKVDSKIVSIIGIRINEYFGCGKFLTVDDFITDEKMRSKGYGKKIFEWVVEYAKENGCSQIQLDSNVNWSEAHKFYMNMGLKISHHHFSLEL